MSEDARALAHQTELFATLLARNGPPPRWRRPATFATLIRFILEQQVSLASAQAAYSKLELAIGEPAPERFLELDDARLRTIGFSRQKASYVRGIAELILADMLDLEGVVDAGGEGSAALLEIRGIGPWTVACFDLFVSGRTDIWPTGDRALYVSLSRNLGHDGVMSKELCDQMATRWKPYRSTAAMMLWHDYLGGRAYELDPAAGFVSDTGMVSE
ncbi:MAG: DNA-3-methyladenine glycosylase 2 family protein [Proteobacteria bacterium]|nr:DNA-3-methyladenine glycosylase 2 family protein [Pseudomonadota bacterium]